MLTDYDYRAHPRKTVRFHASTTYSRVLELAARDIERAGAGRIVDPAEATGEQTTLMIDASHAFRIRRKRRA